MPIRARLTPTALGELREATNWIAADSPRAARAMRQAVQAAAQLIAEHPRIGVVRPEIAPEPYRVVVIRGFSYLMVYDPTPRPPSILRIVHGARDLPEVLKDL